MFLIEERPNDFWKNLQVRQIYIRQLPPVAGAGKGPQKRGQALQENCFFSSSHNNIYNLNQNNKTTEIFALFNFIFWLAPDCIIKH